MNTLLSSLCSHLHLKPEHTALLDERDTSDVWRQFAIWLLVDEEYGVIRFAKPGTLQYKAIQQVAQLYIEDCKDRKRWKAAASVAASAAWAAAKAAGYAAAWSAEAAATHAAYDANDVEAAAEAAYYAASAAADTAHYKRMANKLIELINAAPLITTNK